MTSNFPTAPPAPLSSSDLREDATESRASSSKLRTDGAPGLDGLWDLYGNDLYSVALWRCNSIEDAEDAVQDVFLRLARRPHLLSRLKNPRAYLLRMARNAAVDALKGRTKGIDLEINPELFRFDPDFENGVDARHALEALRHLPIQQREVILMRHILELSFREIGRVCRVPIFTAASRYRLAIARLRSILGVKT